MIRPLAWMFPLYAAAVGLKNAAYDRGWNKPQRLAWPVVSIGNLSVGGSGKTPFVIHLAQMLAAQSIPVDVLSRGYGRSGSATERVDPGGDAERFGDEPLLIARSANCPVYVGASRYEAGLVAERLAPNRPGIHLLDDGFQHRKLARALDIVLLRPADLDDMLLPAGRLREPLASLHRASAIVLRPEDRATAPVLRARGITAPVWIQHRQLVVETTGRAIAFCGIAHPKDFFTELCGLGVVLAETIAFPDHQRYSSRALAKIIAALRRHQAECFITTEKDLVRMTPAQRAQLESAAPVRTGRLTVTLEDEAAIVDQISQLLVRK